MKQTPTKKPQAAAKKTTQVKVKRSVLEKMIRESVRRQLGDKKKQLQEQAARARRGAPADEHMVDELVLYISNDGQLYQSRVIPIVKNLHKKVQKGVYNPELAVKLWKYLADAGAQKYGKEFDMQGAISVATRVEVAKKLRDEYEELVQQGLSMKEQKTKFGRIDGDKLNADEMVDDWMDDFSREDDEGEDFDDSSFDDGDEFELATEPDFADPDAAFMLDDDDADDYDYDEYVDSLEDDFDQPYGGDRFVDPDSRPRRRSWDD